MEQPLFTELLFFKLQGTDNDSVKEMRHELFFRGGI